MEAAIYGRRWNRCHRALIMNQLARTGYVRLMYINHFVSSSYRGGSTFVAFMGLALHNECTSSKTVLTETENRRTHRITPRRINKTLYRPC